MTTRSESAGLTVRLLLGLVGLLLASCSSPIYPTTTGSHVPTDPFMAGGPRQTFVLWPQGLGSDDPGTLASLTSWLLAGHARVVERATVQRLLDEQRFQLQHSADQDADLLRVGHMAGATQILFIQISTEGYSDWPVSMTVSLRSVDVASGQVQWTGSASASADSAFYNLSRQETAPVLAQFALRRAACRIEQGKRWVEPGPKAPRGACQ